MASLEDYTPDQQRAALNLFEFVNKNPDLAKQVRRAAKKADPNFKAPDLELEDSLAAQREEFQVELKKRDDADLQRLQETRRAEAHQRIKSAGLTPEEVEKVMVDESIGNYDTAINYVKAQKALAPATSESISPHSLPDNKDLWKDKNGFARRTAFDAINELKSGRVAAR